MHGRGYGFLSPDGWVRMADWNGHEVLVYDPETDAAVFEHPAGYLDLPCDEFWHFKNSKGMNQMVSDEHRMLVFHGHKSERMNHSVMQPSEACG